MSTDYTYLPLVLLRLWRVVLRPRSCAVATSGSGACGSPVDCLREHGADLAGSLEMRAGVAGTPSICAAGRKALTVGFQVAPRLLIGRLLFVLPLGDRRPY